MQDREKRFGAWLITAAVSLLILTAALTHN
jgi:hypothetical protein